jgi:cysteinyl-tRNA synthetase
MSKSIGNVHTVPDVVAKGYRASALRYLLLSVALSQAAQLHLGGMDQAEESLRRVVDFLARLDDVRGGEAHPDVDAMVAKARSAFRQALESDLNTAAALAGDLRPHHRRQHCHRCETSRRG